MKKILLLIIGLSVFSYLLIDSKVYADEIPDTLCIDRSYTLMPFQKKTVNLYLDAGPQFYPKLYTQLSTSDNNALIYISYFDKTLNKSSSSGFHTGGIGSIHLITELVPYTTGHIYQVTVHNQYHQRASITDRISIYYVKR